MNDGHRRTVALVVVCALVIGLLTCGVVGPDDDECKVVQLGSTALSPAEQARLCATVNP